MAFALSSGMAGAQGAESQEARNAISVDLLAPLLQLAFNISLSGSSAVPIEISYQRVVADNFVFNAEARVIYTTSVGLFDLSPWVEVDWHPFDRGLSGIFIGPALSFDFSLNLFNSFYCGLGGSVGYQLLLPLNIDLVAISGITYGLEFFKQSTIFRPSLRLEIDLGYRF